MDKYVYAYICSIVLSILNVVWSIGQVDEMEVDEMGQRVPVEVYSLVLIVLKNHLKCYETQRPL